MRAGSKIVYAIGAFLGVLALVYIFGTVNLNDDGYLYRAEWVGITAFVLSFALAMMLGGYLHITERRTDVLPEDWEEAEVEDKAGVLGFFSPNSIWPAALAFAITVLGYGLVFFYYWMILLGIVLAVWAATMMNLQYGMPKEKH